MSTTGPTHAVCPGSFDPPTNGHLDIIARAAVLFERLTVAVLVNPDKRGMFPVDQRKELLSEIVARWPHVTVDSFSGLLVDYCTSRGVTAIVKGLRGAADFEYERPMDTMNTALAAPATLTTLFLASSPQVAHLSSSLVKQVATLGADVSEMVPPGVAAALRARLL